MTDSDDSTTVAADHVDPLAELVVISRWENLRAKAMMHGVSLAFIPGHFGAGVTIGVYKDGRVIEQLPDLDSVRSFVQRL